LSGAAGCIGNPFQTRHLVKAMDYSAVLNTLMRSAEAWQATIPEDWLQGRTTFGGLQAALAVGAMRDLLGTDAPLRTLQTTFVAPLPAGALSIRARVLRAGKSATQIEAQLFDGEQIACTVLGVFGAARSSKIAIAPTMPAIDSAHYRPIDLPFIAGVTPTFTQHFAFRWVQGGLPFTAAAEASTKVLVRLRDPAATGEARVIALADSIPSPALSTLKMPVPASSLTWTLELLGTAYQTDTDAYWRIDAEATAAADGYINQSAILYAPDATAVALSRQSVVVFA